MLTYVELDEEEDTDALAALQNIGILLQSPKRAATRQKLMPVTNSMEG